MIKLINILSEIKIIQSPEKTLKWLESLQTQIKQSKDKVEKISLALQCAKTVLFIFEKEHPGDNRPRKAIEATEKWLKDPSEENRLEALNAADASYNAISTDASAASDAAAYTAINASYAINNAAYTAINASYATNKAIYATTNAIIAFKEYYKLK